MTRPIVGITMGDPAGIGPEVVLRACANIGAALESRLVVLGDPGHISAAANQLGLELEIAHAASPAEIESSDTAASLAVLCCAEVEEGVAPGRSRPADGRAALDCIVAGADMAATGELTALVTAPVSKASVAGQEPGFRGHTEFLAARAGVAEPVMVFVGPRPAVALLTTHLPLASAIASVRQGRLLSLLQRLDAGWSRWFGESPQIGVAALNPHAGEGGILGTEEQREILPAIVEARAGGLAVSGPFPADSVFRHQHLDVVVALYHDQGTIIAKRAAEPSVNVTLGLPYPRTSPDHGVAFDRAGRGEADPEPMEAAIRMADRMAASR